MSISGMNQNKHKFYLFFNENIISFAKEHNGGFEQSMELLKRETRSNSFLPREGVLLEQCYDSCHKGALHPALKTLSMFDKLHH